MPDTLHTVSDLRFDPWYFMTVQLAARAREDGILPNPLKRIGCHAYAGSTLEKRRHNLFKDEVRQIMRRAEKLEGIHFGFERDTFGNTYARYFGADQTAPEGMIGSHLDTVANGGQFDGSAGVAFGLAVLEMLADSEESPPYTITVVAFSSEESSPRNGIACLGSLYATGKITLEKFKLIKYEGEQLLWDRYSPEEQRRIEYELAHARITRERVRWYLETHIEQGPLVAAAGKQIGIVTPSIGGAWRERHAKRSFRTYRSRIERGKLLRCMLTFSGTPAHTGMALPNRSRYAAIDQSLARKDALVASCDVLTQLLERHDVRFVWSKPKKGTECGFTTVPYKQVVQVAFSATKRRDMRLWLAHMAEWCEQKLGVGMNFAIMPMKARWLEHVDRQDALRLLRVPMLVSMLASDALLREGGTYGKTRATVTDFFFSPKGLVLNFDGRETDRAAGAVLAEQVAMEFRVRLGEHEIERVSAKGSEPTHRPYVEMLKQVADELSVTYEELSSLAGHDADRIGAAGIPIAMLFYRQHNGVSHNPEENLEREDFETGNRVAMRFVQRLIAA